MLVHAKNPRGVICLGPYKIYGAQTGQPPYDVPFEIYIKFRDALEDATYREAFLSRIFKKTFPEVAFKYSELKILPDKTIDTIGPLIVENYKKKWPHKRKIDAIKRGIANVSPSN